VISTSSGSPPAGAPSSSPLFTLNPTQFGHLPAASPATLKSPLPISCMGDAGNTDPVAIVTIKGKIGAFLRDYADEASPQNLCFFGPGVVVTEILDPHHVVISSPVAAVVELPTARVFELGIGGIDRQRDFLGAAGNALAQAAAVEALEHQDAVIDRVARNVAERISVDERLRALGIEPADSQANFCWFELGAERDEQVVMRGLQERGVLVRGGSALGGAGSLRVTYGTPDENARFLDALAEVL